MKRADLTLFIDGAGAEHVAIVTGENTDGTVDLAVLKPTLRNVPRSAIGTPHSAFDIDAPRETLALEEKIEPGKVAVLRPFPGQEKFFNKGAAAGQALFQGDVIRPTSDALFQGDVIRPTSDGGVEVLPDAPDGSVVITEQELKQGEQGAVETSPDQGPISGG